MFSKVDGLKYERIIVWIVASLLFGGILFGTGTIFSGWHLVDDHETVRIVELYRNKGIFLGTCYIDWMHSDMTHRWRPLYWLLRVSEAYLFGWNSVIPNILLCFAGIVTYILLYWTARNLSCNMGISHMFSLIILLGRQFEVWYRIANQENIGLMLFALTLYLLTKQFSQKKYSNIGLDIGIILAGILCSCMKESFVLLLPAIVLLRVGFEQIAIDDGKFNLIRKCRKNIVFIMICGCVLLAHLYIIVFCVGTNSIGYAGIDPDSTYKEYVWKILRMCKGSLKIFVLLGIVIIFLCLVSILMEKMTIWKNKLWKLLTVVGTYIISSQMILHAKSDMWDRYLIPGIVGYAMVFVIGMNLLINQIKVKNMYYVILCIFLIMQLWMSAGHMSYNYAKEGNDTKELFEDILNNTESSSVIVTDMQDGERDMALGIFLELQGRPYVYVYNEDTGNYEDAFGQKRPLEESDETMVYITRPDVQGRFAPGMKDNRDFYNIDDRYYVYISKHR